MIALHYIYIVIYQDGFWQLRHQVSIHTWQSLEEVVSQAAQEVGVPQLSCYTSFGLLNISINKANSFCYVCGDFTTVARRRTITSLLRTAYFHYFDRKIGDQDKSWVPHSCCKPYYNGLTGWFNGKKAAFNFAVPMVWRETQNHADDCYFLLTNITGFNASSRKKIKYPHLRSAMRPVPDSDDLPVPTPPVNKDLLSSSDEEMPSREDSAESISLEDIESTYSGTSGNEPPWITQEDLNDLACDLYVSKQQSELWLLGLNSGT